MKIYLFLSWLVLIFCGFGLWRAVQERGFAGVFSWTDIITIPCAIVMGAMIGSAVDRRVGK